MFISILNNYIEIYHHFHDIFEKECPVPLGTGHILRTFNAEIQDQRKSGKGKKQNKGNGIAAEGGLQAAASGGDKGSADEVTVHNAEVCGEMLLPVESRGKGGNHGGAGAVGKTRQAKTRHANRHRGGQNGEKGRPRRHDGQERGNQHRLFSAEGIEGGARQNSAETVADGKHPNKGGSKGFHRPNREGKVSCKADD